MKFRVRFEQGADGYIVAECLDIHGCMSQGLTLEEAEANIRDAILSCLRVLLKDAMKTRRERKMTRTDKQALIKAFSLEFV